MSRTRTIELTQGKVAIVDEADYKWLNCWKWYTHHGYASRNKYNKADGISKTIIMQRLIMDAPDGLQVDHINHNTLDNRRSNLRVCTQKENVRNRLNNSNSFSKYSGVDWHKGKGKWRSRIAANGKSYHIGLFANEADAGRAYNAKAKELFGKFACLNNIVPVGDTYPMWGVA